MPSLRALRPCILSVVWLLVGCGSDVPSPPDAALDAGGVRDAGLDAGSALDAAPAGDAAPDALAPGPDAGGDDAAGIEDGGDLDAAEPLDGGGDASEPLDPGADASEPLDAGGDASVGTCQAAPTDGWRGQIAPGLVASAPPTHDAGIAAVLAAAPASGSVAIDLIVDGAVVTATGFRPSATGVPNDVWVADSSGGLHVRAAVPAAVAVGNRVRFRVRSVARVLGGVQADAIEGWTTTASGEPVFVEEAHGRSLAADDVARVLHTWGELASDPVACGGSSVCADVVTGAATVELRAPALLGLARGDCVEVAMPVFAGPSGPHLDVRLAEWQRRR